jgi:hypothetical protein
MEEPSVLDYLKSKLLFWRTDRIEIRIPSQEDLATPLIETTSTYQTSIQNVTVVDQPITKPVYHWAWRPLLALVLAMVAQYMLEPPEIHLQMAIGLYFMVACLIVWAIFKNEWDIAPLREEAGAVQGEQKINWKLLVISLPIILISFITFSGNQFNFFNLLLWAALIIFVLSIFWIPRKKENQISFSQRIIKLLNFKSLNIKITPWVILIFVTVLLVAFFRFFHLSQVPGEMFSDHAEKLLDVSDVIHGKYSIFFPRNTGREAIQMYLTAFIATALGTGLTFISLKIGTTMLGFLTLPYVYFLGKRIGNRWVGYLAFLMVGISYWHNVISRVGL